MSNQVQTLDRNYFRRYEAISREMIPHLRADRGPPKHLRLEYEAIRDDLRMHLDQCGYHMPKKKWNYTHEDKKTWPIKDVIIVECNGERIYVGSKPNEHFCYSSNGTTHG